MIEQLSKRVEELTKALEHSVANHNGLIGALQEAKSILELAKQEEEAKAAPESSKVYESISDVSTQD